MVLPKPLKCSEAGRRDVLLALLQHDLTDEDEDRLLEHLRKCPHCLSSMATVLGEVRLDGSVEKETRP